MSILQVSCRYCSNLLPLTEGDFYARFQLRSQGCLIFPPPDGVERCETLEMRLGKGQHEVRK